MAQPLDVRRLLATGRQMTETGRTQVAQLGNELVEQGRQATDQISAVVEQLVNPVGRNRVEDIRQMVQAEVKEQLRTLGAEIKDHLAEGQLVADRIAELGRQRREHAEELREAVRDEVQRQMSTLGLATKEDLLALRRAIPDDLTALQEEAAAAAWATTATEPSGQRDTGTVSEVSARSGEAMQVTPPHQRSSTVMDTPTSSQ